MRAKRYAIGFAVMGLVVGGLWLGLRPSPRDPDSVYQAGNAVGKVIGAKEDARRGEVYFEQIDTGGLFDQFQDFEYRGYVLHITSEEVVGTTRMGNRTSENFIHVVSRVAGKRS